MLSEAATFPITKLKQMLPQQQTNANLLLNKKTKKKQQKVRLGQFEACSLLRTSDCKEGTVTFAR